MTASTVGIVVHEIRTDGFTSLRVHTKCGHARACSVFAPFPLLTSDSTRPTVLRVGGQIDTAVDGRTPVPVVPGTDALGGLFDSVVLVHDRYKTNGSITSTGLGTDRWIDVDILGGDRDRRGLPHGDRFLRRVRWWCRGGGRRGDESDRG